MKKFKNFPVTIRVISGKYKGFKILQPSSAITRAMKDSVKESIFNILQFQIKGAIVLDLFAGSGGLSIESVSRGALKVVSVEKSLEAFQIIKKNVDSLKIRNIDLKNYDVLDFLSHAKGTKYDLIFVDPPFADYNLCNSVLQNIFMNKILKTTGYIIIQSDDLSKLIVPKNFIIFKKRKFGISEVWILTNNI